MSNTMRYDEIYPYLGKNALINKQNLPINWKVDLELADNEAFMAHQPLEKLHL